MSIGWREKITARVNASLQRWLREATYSLESSSAQPSEKGKSATSRRHVDGEVFVKSPSRKQSASAKRFLTAEEFLQKAHEERMLRLGQRPPEGTGQLPWDGHRRGQTVQAGAFRYRRAWLPELRNDKKHPILSEFAVLPKKYWAHFLIRALFAPVLRIAQKHNGAKEAAE